MIRFVVSNVDFGAASDPVDTGEGAISIHRLELDATNLEVLGVGTTATLLRGRRFDLFNKVTRRRHQGCRFESWRRAEVEGDTVVIEDAAIRYENRAILRPPPRKGA
jgi:hypothetical protein